MCNWGARQHVIHCLFDGVYTTKRIIMDIDDDRIKDITLREERRFELACLVWLSIAGAWTHSQHE